MKNLIPSLNGLRALSILLVVFSHLSAAGLPAFDLSTRLINLDGNFGVNVFFVISGFLITTLLLEEEKANRTISLKAFYIRRIFRIFPAYYFILLVYFFLELFSILHFTTGSWLSSIFYYKYLAKGPDSASTHFWSLSVEEHFYLVWPLVFKFGRKIRVPFAFGIIFLVFVYRVVGYFGIFHSSLLTDWAFIFQRADAIMIGCLFAIFREPIGVRIEKAAKTGYFFPIVILLALLNSSIALKWCVSHHLHLGFLLAPLGVGWPIGTLSNLCVALLLVYSIQCRNGWFTFLNLPFMNFIGKMSYSIYLWQQLFILCPQSGILSTFPLNLCCTFLAALFSYFLIERPFLSLRVLLEKRSVAPGRVFVLTRLMSEVG